MYCFLAAYRTFNRQISFLLRYKKHSVNVKITPVPIGNFDTAAVFADSLTGGKLFYLLYNDYRLKPLEDLAQHAVDQTLVEI